MQLYKKETWGTSSHWLNHTPILHICPHYCIEWIMDSLREQPKKKKTQLWFVFVFFFCFFIWNLKVDMVSDKMEGKKQMCLHAKTTAPRWTNIMSFFARQWLIQWFKLSWASLFSAKFCQLVRTEVSDCELSIAIDRLSSALILLRDTVVVHIIKSECTISFLNQSKWWIERKLTEQNI